MVVELKVGRFKSGYLGQLGTYVAVVDDRVRDHAVHAPTVGILLCTSRDEQVVRYALSSAAAPIAVATYETLTPEQRAGLPDPAHLSAALAEVQHAGHPAVSSPGVEVHDEDQLDEVRPGR